MTVFRKVQTSGKLHFNSRAFALYAPPGSGWEINFSAPLG